MDSELCLKNLKEIFISYLKNISGRKNLYSRAMSAIINSNSKTKKLCLAITREIFEDENNACYLFLNDKEISNKLLNLLKNGIEIEIKFDHFISEFFSLSKVFEFVFKISKAYSRKEDYWGECIELFLFKKKFKSDYINNILFMFGKNKINITYDDFFEKIKDNYDNTKEFKDEFLKIFADFEERKEQMNVEKQLQEKIEENIDIINQINENSKSENGKTKENSLNGNGTLTKELEVESNNEKNMEDNKMNEIKNIIEKKSKYSELHKENKLEKDEEFKNEIVETKLFDIKNTSDIEIITTGNTVLNYLKSIFSKNKKEYYLPILKKKIVRKTNFQLNEIGYYEKSRFNPKYKLNDKILSELIDKKLKLNEFMGDKNEYGYFCYYIDNCPIEALYSTINPVYLYNYSEVKDLIDDYYKPNELIQNIFIKSRAMTLEYYINSTIFIEKYGAKPYPRIIFPLDPSKKLPKYLSNEVEIDGAFFISEPFSMNDIDLPFAFQQFLSYTGSNKIFSINNESYDINGKYFEKGDLCLIEIKTKFPEKEIPNQSSNELTFPEVLDKMLDKMIIFEQLFKTLGVKYERIRLILFYDLIKKKSYVNVITRALEKFGDKYYYLDYLDKIYIQVIYINSSYFIETLRSNRDIIKNLKETIKIINDDINYLNKKVETQNEIIKQLQDEKKELQIDNKQLFEALENSINALEQKNEKNGTNKSEDK